jgi:hypothetical protein
MEQRIENSLGQGFPPVLKGISKCSLSLLTDIGVIFEKSDVLDNDTLNHQIDLWIRGIETWKFGGFFSAVWTPPNFFFNKKGICFDNTLLFISNSISDMDVAKNMKKGRHVVASSDKENMYGVRHDTSKFATKSKNFYFF